MGNSVFAIMQGDQYAIPFEISTESGIADESTFSEVEIVLGGIRKTLSSKGVTYDAEKKSFMFHVTQEETFRLSNSSVEAKIRVKPKGTDAVIGADVGSISIIKSTSKVVL